MIKIGEKCTEPVTLSGQLNINYNGLDVLISFSKEVQVNVNYNLNNLFSGKPEVKKDGI